MGIVPSNGVSLLASREASPGVLQGTPVVDEIEYNEVPSYGTVTEKQARRPVSRRRGRRKGAVINADSPASIDTDATIAAFRRFVDAFTYSEVTNVESLVVGGDIGAAGALTVPALSALAAGKLAFGANTNPLIVLKGYMLSANSGVKVVDITTPPAATDTSITVTGAVTETAPANAQAEICGIRLAAAAATMTLTDPGGGANLQLTVVGGVAIPNWNFLQLGQWVWIGGVDIVSESYTSVNNPTSGGGANTHRGWARLASKTGDTAIFDKLDTRLIAGQPAATAFTMTGTVDILISRFNRDLTRDDAADDKRFATYTDHLERAYPNLAVGGATQYEYVPAAQPDSMTISIPESGFVQLEMSFIGQASEPITSTRKTGFATALAPVGTEALSQVQHFFTSDLTALAADICVNSMTLTIENNTTAEKCHGKLGPSFTNVGAFFYNIEGVMAFTSADMRNAVTENRTITFTSVLANADGAIIFDAPSLTLGGGNLDLPQDQAARINLSGESFTDETFGYDLGVSVFAIVPLVLA